jgi:hypothetical protein
MSYADDTITPSALLGGESSSYLVVNAGNNELKIGPRRIKHYMKCPNCGAPHSIDQQFCRSCGVAVGTVLSTRNNWNWVPLLGVIMAFAGIIVAILGTKLFSSETVKLIGVLIAITGMFVVPISSLIPRRRVSTQPAPLTHDDEYLTPAPATKKLAPITGFEPVGSVTENTTDLLKVPSSGS